MDTIISEDTLLLISWVAMGLAILYAWVLFFRIRSLEKNVPEKRKSLIAKSCAAPLWVTIALFSCFGTPLPNELSTGAGVMWLLFLVLSFIVYVFLIFSHARAKLFHNLAH